MKKILLVVFLLLMTMVSYGQEAVSDKTTDNTNKATLMSKKFSLDTSQQEAVREYFNSNQYLRSQKLSNREIELKKAELQLKLASMIPEDAVYEALKLATPSSDTDTEAKSELSF